jgi:translation initiation factor 3 subunit B
MAPSFDHLPDPDEDEYDEDELDFSDLQEKYHVQMQQGLDTFIVADGLPKVTAEQKPKLIRFLLRKLNDVGRTRDDLVHMPVGENGETDGSVRDCFCSSPNY